MADEIFDPNSVLPSYRLNAESHNLMNSMEDKSQFGPMGALEGIGKFVSEGIPLAVGSAATQLYNTIPTVGNWLGGEYEMVDFRSEVKSYDDDLAKYYDAHSQGIDAVGFMMSSMVTGMGGVKVLRGGQAMMRGAIEAGTVGEGLGTALGLKATHTEKYLSQAIKEIRTSGNLFDIAEANTLRAIGSGFAQQALEAGAFELTVAATMHNSPIMKDMSGEDMFWNGLIGIGLGGGIGGSIEALLTRGAIKNAAVTAEKELMPWALREVPASGTSISDQIVFRTVQKYELPELPEASHPLFARIEKTRNKSMADLDLEIRSLHNSLTNDDVLAGQALHDISKVVGREQAVGNMIDVTSVSRAGQRSAYESKMAAIFEKMKKEGIDSVTDDEFKLWADSKVTYLAVRGEHQNSTVMDKPEILSVFDKIKSGDTVELTKDGIRIGKEHFVHTNNPAMPYNILNNSHYKTEARYVWAEKLDRWSDADQVTIGAHDLPLIEKAWRDGLTKVQVVPVDKESGLPLLQQMYMVEGRDAVKALMINQKQEVMNLLRTGNVETQTLDTLMDKLLTHFGIRINTFSEPASDGKITNAYYHWVTGKSGKFDMTGDVIAFNKLNLIDKGKLLRPLSSIIKDLKHEEGHSIFSALLRGAGVGRSNVNFATSQKGLIDELVKISKKERPKIWNLKDKDWIEYRNRHQELFADAFGRMSQHPEELSKYPFFEGVFGHLVRPIPDSVLEQLAVRFAKPTEAEIAKITNMREHVLRGEVITDKANSRELTQFLARDEFRQDYYAKMEKAGTRVSETATDPLHLPSYLKVISVANHTKNAEGLDVPGLAGVMQRVTQYDQAAARVAQDILGEQFPNWGALQVLRNKDDSSSFVGSANANYGAQGSIAQYVGQRTHQLISKAKQATSDLFTPHLSKLAADTDAAIEWSLLNERLRSLPQGYYLTEIEGGRTVLRHKSVISSGMPAAELPDVPLRSSLVKDLAKAHISQNGGNLTKLGKIRSVEGKMDTRDPLAFYPIPRSPKNTPFFAFVIDDSPNSTGHHSMIYAASEKELETLKNKIAQDLDPNFKVISKAESEKYFKAHGQFQFERAVNDNYIDEMLKRKGKSSSMLPVTDPAKIVEDFLDWHLNRASNVVREAVSLRYSRQFGALRQAAEETQNLAHSRFGYTSVMEAAENAANNPAMNSIKTALDIQKSTEYPYWTSVNKMLDGAVSRMFAGVDHLWKNATSTEHLAEINRALHEQGWSGPVVDEVLYKAMNSAVPRGTLTALVNKANGLLATFALRLDPLNALNNAIGHTVLYGTELKSVLQAIGRGDKESVGALAELTRLKVPGTTDSIFSPGKLIANAIANYHNPALRQMYKDRGFITSISEQYDQTIDQIALSLVGKSTVQKAMDTANKWGNAGEKLTGNKFAEEFNRFVAADTMRQITDVAVKAGKMDTETAMTYINTFVNRTQGNYLASQRPLLFQGPIGQAMGLFQTYQFNLLQQLLRHIESRDGRVIATMAGLQAGIYGMNGLPAFNAINTHIIGNASGNSQHKDFYNVAYSAAGKEAGDWLMYGFGSNALGLFHPDLKNNLYVRGDINPRQLTLVPVNPAEIPIVATAGKFFSNIKETFQKVNAGGDVWGSFLSALEHNGVSRPLTGLAQVLGGATRPDGKVVSTSTKDSILMAHDLYSLSSMMRLAGAKPLDEALTNDAVFRMNAYQAHDTDMRNKLGSAVKTSILFGEQPDQKQLDSFASEYVQRGGKQDRYAQWMASQYKNANNSQANQLREKLSSFKNQQLQTLLGGGTLEDLGTGEKP